MIVQTIKCDVCGAEYAEEVNGAGFPSWGALQGVVLDGVGNPNLCPKHLKAMAKFMDDMKKEYR